MIIIQIIATCLGGIIAGLVIARMLGLKLNPLSSVDEILAMEKKLAVERPPESPRKSIPERNWNTTSGMMANVACVITGISDMGSRFRTNISFH